jgi:hypothetical protein
VMKFISRAPCLALASCLSGALCSSWAGDWRTDAAALENHVLYSNSLATARHVELLLPRWTASTNGPYQTNLVNAMVGLSRHLKTNAVVLERLDLTSAAAMGRLELYLDIALTHPGAMSAEAEMRLLTSFPWGGWNRTLDTNSFVAHRRKQLVWWLHLVKRAQETVEAFDPNDPKNRPLASVPAPGQNGMMDVGMGTGIGPPPVVPPSTIKDPLLREQYEEALALNRRKWDDVRDHQRQEGVLRALSFLARFHIRSLYHQEPFMGAEAREVVAGATIKPEIKQAILDAIRETPD